jgi:hypothetical protein
MNIFQNYYVFEGIMGLFTLYAGIQLFESMIVPSIFFVLGGFSLMVDAIFRWNKLQKNKEAINESEAESKNLILDFDIRSITCENEIEYVPDDFNEEGYPIDFKEENVAFFKIELLVCNPNGSMKNLIRKIEAFAAEGKSKKSLNIDFNPVQILPRESIPVSMKGEIWGYSGSKKKQKFSLN